jgi:hypothetical protein
VKISAKYRWWSYILVRLDLTSPTVSPSHAMADFDSPWKDAIDCYFPSFIAFFFPDIDAAVDWSRGHEMLDKELRQIVREAEMGRRHVDKLVKIWRKDGAEAWVLIHIEVQAQREDEFARRMYVYNYRLFDRYNQAVVSLAVLADEQSGWRPRAFKSSLWGCTAGIEFPAVKLLDYGEDESALERDKNPFAFLVLAHLKTQQTRSAPESRRAWKMRLVRGLYDGGWQRLDIENLFRFIDWMMDLPPALSGQFWTDLQEFEEEKKMPYVTSVERIGIEKGLEQGRKEGLQQGLRQGLQQALVLGLKLKFGPSGKKLLPRIKRIEDIAVLETLQSSLAKAATLDEFRDAIP